MQEATETEFQYAGNSLFALLQGATRYTNHNHSKGSEDFVQYGTGATINQKAEKLALQMLQTA